MNNLTGSEEMDFKQLESFVGPKAKGIWVIPYERKECPQITSDRLSIVTREVDFG